MENYKEKYEEALEGIQEILSSGADSIKMSRLRLRLEGIFHELKESEDERIRKALIDYFDNANKTNENPLMQYGIYTDKVITWLKKQGEKPQGKSAIKALKEEKIDNQNCVKSADMVKPKFEVGDTIVPKHNPTTNKIYFTITDITGGKYWYNDRIICDIAEQDEWEVLEQKSAWSEEDEHRFKDTIYFLDTAKKHYASTVELDACIDWLKSLKQRIMKL